MIWGCICWHGVCPIGKVDRNINALKYIDITEFELWLDISRPG